MGENKFGRWMALDIGRRRIGVAFSDPLKLTARPAATLTRSADSAEIGEIIRLVGEYDVERIVVGRPLRLNGETSDTVDLVEAFLQQLRECVAVPVEWAEERLSSKEAERIMSELKVPVADRRRRRDEFAAALILQWYIEENGEARA
jgi:putative Holliday junction resolvase